MARSGERGVDVVVIGGGVIGASVAHHLAARGCTRVAVLDAAPAPGLGSTGRATGGFRAQFATPVNVALSLLARGKLRDFEEEIGTDSGYRPHGYLFIATDEAHLDVLRAAQGVQRAAGLHEAVELGPDDVRALNPAIHGDDVVGGAFCPTDGFLRPLAILDGYRVAASRRGVSFTYGTEVRGLRMEGARVTAVETSAGPVPCGMVVNAAGAWAAAVARMAGAEVPVTPVRRHVAATATCEVLPAGMPMTIFTDDGFHFRVRDGRVLLLWPGPAEPYDDARCGSDEIRFDDRWLDAVAPRAHRRVPCLTGVPLDRAACAAGLYENSPDGHALLGLAPGTDNLYLANGSSGHGVMHAPALGHLVAELLLDGRVTTLDARPLRPERFAEGDGCTVPDLF